MKNLKWWHWVLIVFIGPPFIIAVFGDPDRHKGSAATASKEDTVDAEAKFDKIGGDGMFAMTFNPAVDPEQLPDIAREQCGRRSICMILGWTDPKYAAKAMPMTEREVSKLAFQYNINRTTGMDRALWDCKVWARVEEEECLSS